MSEILEFSQMVAKVLIDLATEHGLILVLLAMLGVFSIISAIGSKVFSAFRYLFMIFVAIPAIIVVGLLNKSNRKKRKKELGDIKAHLKQHPEKWKRMLYFGLLMLFIIVFALVLWGVASKFIFPFYELNEATKVILNNRTNITS